MDVSQSLYAIGIKDKTVDMSEKVKRHIAIEIIFSEIIGKSSKLYKKLYDEGIVYSVPSIDYEFTNEYAHIIISGQSNSPKRVYELFKQELEDIKKNGLSKEDFERLKKKIYGMYVREYDDVADIARMFLADYFKGINSFDYLEEIEAVSYEYASQILKEIIQKNNMVFSVVEK